MFGKAAPRGPKRRIVVTRKLPVAVEDRLRAEFTVALNPDDTPFTPDRLMKAMQMADGLLCAVTDAVTSTVLHAEGRRRVEIVANFGVDVNNIDLNSARASGVVVGNTPDVLTDATADLAIALYCPMIFFGSLAIACAPTAIQLATPNQLRSFLRGYP